jgi:hypothetical protein
VRTLRLVAPLAFLALARAAPAAEPSEVSKAALESLRRDTERITDELESALAQLAILRKEYAKGEGLEGLAERRRTVRARAESLLGQLYAVGDEFTRQRIAYEDACRAFFIQRFIAEKTVSRETYDERLYLKELAAFTNRFAAVRLGAKKALADEENAFTEAEQSVRTRRRGVRLTALAAALPLLIWLGHSLYLRFRPAPTRGMFLGGDFRLVRELGRGSLGTTFEYLEVRTRKKMVLKRIRKELHPTPDDAAKLLALGHSLTRLRHPNIAQVHDAFLDAGRLHIVMESVDGLPLASLLEREGRVGLKAACGILAHVAAALQAAHGMGIIHGSLTPSDILVGRDGWVKVTDLSLGAEVRKRAGKFFRTGSLGNRSYMAPEVELGRSSPRSDVFSMGVVFYQMLTGRLPFPGPDFLAQKNEQRYPPPSRIAAAVSVDSDPVLIKAMAPKPEDRHPSADAFAKELSLLAHLHH